MAKLQIEQKVQHHHGTLSCLADGYGHFYGLDRTNNFSFIASTLGFEVMTA